MKVQVELIGPQLRFPLCKAPDAQCVSTRECANHETAGDFRTEDGLTPDLRQVGGAWECSGNPRDHDGAVLAGGKLARPKIVVWNGKMMREGKCPPGQTCLACDRLGMHLEPASDEELSEQATQATAREERGERGPEYDPDQCVMAAMVQMEDLDENLREPTLLRLASEAQFEAMAVAVKAGRKPSLRGAADALRHAATVIASWRDGPEDDEPLGLRLASGHVEQAAAHLQTLMAERAAEPLGEDGR
jgi:hypothetical protein